MLVIVIYYSVAANIDLSLGRFALYMDERITFDGVKTILHSNSIRSTLEAIVHGDQRYGRILWASMAGFSFLPEWLWGEEGQIIAGRMLQVFLIIASVLILTFGILSNWFLRVTLLCSIVAMPFSDYYMSMPKPEPIQILFLTIFCYYYFKTNLRFGWYWVFAGLAFGTKISTLPALIIFVISSLWFGSNHYPKIILWRSTKISIFSFLLGLGIAVPILFTAVLLATILFYFYEFAKKNFRLNLGAKWCLIFFGLLVFYTTSKDQLKTWFSSTFLNMTHGGDNVSTTALTWINYFYKTWLNAPEFIACTFLVLALLYVLILCYLNLRDPSISPKIVAASTILLAGLALNFSIFIGVHRLWGMYLYPGMFLFISGLVIAIDQSLSIRLINHSRFFNKSIHVLSIFIASFLFFISAFYWAPNSIHNFQNLALRTETENYANELKSYQEIIKFLDMQYAIRKTSLTVMLTPSIFPPENSEKYTIVEFWGPYDKWDQSPDVIIFGSINTPRGSAYSEGSPEYRKFLLEREGYKRHVSDGSSSCQNKPCFKKVLMLPNDGEILILKN